MLSEVYMSENKKAQSELEPVNKSGISGSGGFVAGLLFGSLAGAGAMLLLAPHSGKRTRADLQAKGIVLRHQATETVEDAVDNARATLHDVKADVRKEARELGQRGQDILDEQKERISEAAAKVQSAVQGS
jgi:gas vesicle protein